MRIPAEIHNEIREVERAELPAMPGPSESEAVHAAALTAYVAKCEAQRKTILRLAEELSEAAVCDASAPDWAVWAARWASIGLVTQDRQLAREQKQHARLCGRQAIRRLLIVIDAVTAGTPPDGPGRHPDPGAHRKGCGGAGRPRPARPRRAAEERAGVAGGRAHTPS
jgi:hypothetical protein